MVVSEEKRLNNKYSNFYKAPEKIYTEISKVKIKKSVIYGEVYIKYPEINSIFIDKLKMKLRNNSKDISYYFDIHTISCNKNNSRAERNCSVNKTVITKSRNK